MINPTLDLAVRQLLKGACDIYSRDWTPASELSDSCTWPPAVIPVCSVIDKEHIVVGEPLPEFLVDLAFSSAYLKQALVHSFQPSLKDGSMVAFILLIESFAKQMALEEYKARDKTKDISQLPDVQTAIVAHLHVAEGVRLYTQRMMDGKCDGDIEVSGLDTERAGIRGVLVPPHQADDSKFQ